MNDHHHHHNRFVSSRKPYSQFTFAIKLRLSSTIWFKSSSCGLSRNLSLVRICRKAIRIGHHDRQKLSFCRFQFLRLLHFDRFLIESLKTFHRQLSPCQKKYLRAFCVTRKVFFPVIFGFVFLRAKTETQTVQVWSHRINQINACTRNFFTSAMNTNNGEM